MTTQQHATLTPECARRVYRGRWAEDVALQRCRFPIGPRNTVSNIAYPLVGWTVVPDVPGWHTILFACAMTFLGLASAAYHGLKTHRANILDHVGMYAVFITLVATAMGLVVPLDPGLGDAAYAIAYGTLVLTFSFALAFLTQGKIRLDVAMAFALSATVGASWFRGSVTLTVASLALFAAGKLCWILDRKRLMPPPAQLWGHALWHVFTATALGVMWLALDGAAR